MKRLKRTEGLNDNETGTEGVENAVAGLNGQQGVAAENLELDEMNLSDNIERVGEGSKPQSMPWPYLSEEFNLIEIKGKMVSLQCLMCLGSKWKSVISCNVSSLSNVYKHLQTNYLAVG